MKTLKLIVTLLVVLMIVTGCGAGGIDGGSFDRAAPSVEAFYPDPAVDGNVSSADIQTNGIKVIFNEGMDGSTLDGASFKVEEWLSGGTAVIGVVTYDAAVRTATFMPNMGLNSSWDYVVTITTAVTDLSSNSLAADYVVTIRIADPVPGPIP